MRTNMYLPHGLPLISDYELYKTAIEYRHVLTVLPSTGSENARETRSAIEAALAAIDREARERGLAIAMLEYDESDVSRYAQA